MDGITDSMDMSLSKPLELDKGYPHSQIIALCMDGVVVMEEEQFYISRIFGE